MQNPCEEEALSKKMELVFIKSCDLIQRSKTNHNVAPISKLWQCAIGFALAPCTSHPFSQVANLVSGMVLLNNAKYTKLQN
jgi:hypothetical protein